MLTLKKLPSVETDSKVLFMSINKNKFLLAVHGISIITSLDLTLKVKIQKYLDRMEEPHWQSSIDNSVQCSVDNYMETSN